MAEGVQLQVAGAVNQDVGKGVARISRAALEKLGLHGGELVQIEAKRSTGVIAVPPYEQDAGLDIIRLDGLIRHNAGVGLADRVTLTPLQPKAARRVVFGPAQERVHLRGSGEALKRTFAGRPFAAGDVVSTSVYSQIPTTGAFPDDVFGAMARRKAFGLQEIRLAVISTQPSGIVVVGEETEIELREDYEEPAEQRVLDVTYDDVGGVQDAIEQVREMVELPLKHPELFQRLGIDPPKGVLLHGPPGTGKTLLARAVANEADANFFVVNGPEIMGKYYGESEERLREIFENAEKNAPSIVFIDEIDSIAPKRDEVTGEGERRLVAQLLTLMDGLNPRQNVIVMGATNRRDSLDEALRRPGRFDRELTIGVPDSQGRREVLEIHTRGMPLGEGVDLDELSRRTFGFVGADLGALAREAALEALRRRLPEIDLDTDEIPNEVLESLFVTGQDFRTGLKRVQPSALREIMIESPDIGWADIGGLQKTKEQLREGIELPLKNPEAFTRMGIRPARGFLLYGPPGTGKTLLAKAVAKEAEANFISTRSSDLLSKWFGESEKQVARLFERARQVAPTVIFIDEIDALAPTRGGSFGEPAVTERVVNTMLAELDGLEELRGVVVIGATNQPTLLDPALLRPGRFDELIYVPVPDEEARLHILKIHTSRMPLAGDVDVGVLAKRTEGHTGADLEDLVRRAGLLALRQSIDASEVPMAIFEIALKDTRASVTPEMSEQYAKMQSTLKQEGPRTTRIGFDT
jgi:transitional endoplasmic reticulum ATPase